MQHTNMVRAGSTSSMGSGTNANPPMPIYKAPTASVERVRSPSARLRLFPHPVYLPGLHFPGDLAGMGGFPSLAGRAGI